MSESSKVFWGTFIAAAAFFVLQPMIAKYSGGIVPAN